jgi:hypothetical protein
MIKRTSTIVFFDYPTTVSTMVLWEINNLEFWILKTILKNKQLKLDKHPQINEKEKI